MYFYQVKVKMLDNAGEKPKYSTSLYLVYATSVVDAEAKVIKHFEANGWTDTEPEVVSVSLTKYEDVIL
jgi:uncharacterized protein YjlB